MISCLKKAMDGKGYILRVYELKGMPEEIELKFDIVPRKIYLTDFLEREKEVLPIEGNTLNLRVRR